MELVGRLQRSAYVDSITLMQAAEQARALPGVSGAAAVVATPANRAAIAEVGLWPDEAAAADPSDIVLAVRAETATIAHAALDRMEAWLRARGTPASAGAPGEATVRPRSIASAARANPGANVAVVTVPGSHAVAEAHQALSAGLHVFLFSDGVAIDDEVALKRRAERRNLLVMGPECGTSLIAGVGLGFANRVRRGSIGLVGASGTGLQEVTSLIHRLGGGVSHAIGTGGRDLDERVGGITTRQALALLARDPHTHVIGLVSKPPSAAVARDVLAAAAATGKPVVACLLGWTGVVPAGVDVADTLEATAVSTVAAAGAAGSARVGTAIAPTGGAPTSSAMATASSGTAAMAPPRPPGAPAGPTAGSPAGAPASATFEPPAIPAGTAPRRPGRVRGLFTGGTLAEEARAVLGDAAIEVIDFGAEEYTRGRPHPMIDPALRAAAVVSAGDDVTTTVVLIDVVLGDCVHPDPAGAVTPGIDEARARARRAGRDLAVVAHVVGTEDDPQRLSAQEAMLRAQGVIVCPSNRSAAMLARQLARAESSDAVGRTMSSSPSGRG